MQRLPVRANVTHSPVHVLLTRFRVFYYKLLYFFFFFFFVSLYRLFRLITVAFTLPILCFGLLISTNLLTHYAKGTFLRYFDPAQTAYKKTNDVIIY